MCIYIYIYICVYIYIYIYNDSNDNKRNTTYCLYVGSRGPRLGCAVFLAGLLRYRIRVRHRGYRFTLDLLLVLR